MNRERTNYEILVAAGHSGAKALEIMLDAKRGCLFSQNWIALQRKKVEGEASCPKE